jgi:hypothetical protein
MRAFWKSLAVTAVVAVFVMMCCVAPASADPPPPGCERVPIFGLNPQIREICDLPMQPDGSWERWRWFSFPSVITSKCGGTYYQGGQCPPWLTRDVAPAWQGPVEKYIVTPDTIPPGEPGYIG